MYNTTSMHRKKHQRKINKQVRLVNKLIEEDSLWRGRFVIRQKAYYFGHYEDKSGWYMYNTLEFRDKKTRITKEYTESAFHWLFGATMALVMNDFIVTRCKVWENEKPYKDLTDYRAVP